MKILALDFGLKRIGLAMSDGKIITTLPTIKFFESQDVLKQIAEICRAEKIETIILGLPQGNIASEDLVRSFAMDLTRISELPVKFTDETLTSKEAERLLKSSKLKPRSEKYKQEVDRLSAKMILEQYLKEQK